MNRVFAVVLAASLGVVGASRAAVVLPNLPEGTQYRIAFISSNTYQSYGGSSNPSLTRSLSYWSNIVTTEAGLSSSPTIQGATFNILGSLYDGSNNINATAITGMSDTVSDNIPVYNTLGELIANNSVEFWSSTRLAGINGDRDGNAVSANAWSGWFPTLQTFRPFGHGVQTYWLNSTSTNWSAASVLGSTNFLRVYAVSAPISAVPAPGAAALLGIGGFVAARRRRPAR